MPSRLDDVTEWREAFGSERYSRENDVAHARASTLIRLPKQPDTTHAAIGMNVDPDM
jgi:hypothetical protein